MIDQHPITPPSKLVQQWWTEFERTEPDTDSLVFIATQAARWGADQELEACYEWLREFYQGKRPGGTENLRRSRRPKPPSLKEQALKALETEDDAMPLRSLERGERFALIRRALEQLDG